MANDRPYYATLPPMRPVLERIYESMHGCPAPPDADLSDQGVYLRFVLPSPDALVTVARALTEEESL